MRLKAVFSGAVLGAYTALQDVGDLDKPTVAILGAIAGAVATNATRFIVDNVEQGAWAEYLRTEN